MTMIPEEEARKLDLPGSDVFLRTQLAYKNEINKEALITFFNREAYQAFTDAIFIGQYPDLQKEMDQRKRDWTIFAPTIFRLMEYRYLDNLKIAAGFELHLKACLVSENIVIHNIKNQPPFKDLCKRQREEPIYKDELLAIEGFYYNGERNILRGLTPKSLGFEQILSPNYCTQLGKPQDLLDIIDDYRNLRNQIHMPGDIVETPHLSKYSGDSLMKILVTFINEEIVGYNNAIVAKGELHSSYNLEPLLYFS
jgi:hypothetical protein